MILSSVLAMASVLSPPTLLRCRNLSFAVVVCLVVVVVGYVVVGEVIVFAVVEGGSRISVAGLGGFVGGGVVVVEIVVVVVDESFAIRLMLEGLACVSVVCVFVVVGVLVVGWLVCVCAVLCLGMVDFAVVEGGSRIGVGGLGGFVVDEALVVEIVVVVVGESLPIRLLL